MNTLFVLVDLGRVRAVKCTQDEAIAGGRRHLAEVPEAAFEREGHGLPLHEVVTDSAGRFAQGHRAGESGGMSYGEDHDLETEIERQAIKTIASHVETAIGAAGFPPTVLAAPKSILKQLQAALSHDAQKAIRETVPADLTKTPLAELEERFLV